MERSKPTAPRDLAGVPTPAVGMIATHLLIVGDQDRARRFYADVLGATVVRARDPVVLRLAGAWLILNGPGGPTPDKPGVVAAPPADRHVFSAALNLRVADAGKTRRAFSAAGGEFLTAPIDRGPEARCFLWDPDGHLIELGQSLLPPQPKEAP